MHFLTGFYYFTVFQIFMIILTGIFFGHTIYRLVMVIQAIRQDQPIKRTLINVVPWFIVTIILMFSPVYSSGLASLWMLIFAVLTIITEFLIVRALNNRQHLNTTHKLHHRHTENQQQEQSIDRYDMTNKDLDDDDTAPDYDYSMKQQQTQPVQQTQPTQSTQSVHQTQPTQPTQPAQASQSTKTVHHKTTEEQMDDLFAYDENTDAELAQEQKQLKVQEQQKKQRQLEEKKQEEQQIDDIFSLDDDNSSNTKGDQ